MPLIFSAVARLYGPIAEFALPAVIAAFVWLWVSDAAKLHQLRSDNASLHSQIDDPNTGFRAQLARVNNNLATAHANEADLTARLTAQNGEIETWKAASDMASQRAKAAQAQAADSEAKARSVASQLAAQRPQIASYDSLVELIREQMPTVPTP